MTDLRLSTREMARFVARGFLRFDEIVPPALNERFLAEVEQGAPQASPAGTPLCDSYPDSVMRDILALPAVQGVIESLVGRDCLFDHQGAHFLHPSSRLDGLGLRVLTQHTHQDSTIDTRRAFDIQAFYYPQAVTPEMGGTRFVPGTHLRRVSEMAIARYQNIRGQRKVVCPAGTMLFFHHGLWHGGELNHSQTSRYMLKVRLNPTRKQVRQWNAHDLTSEMYDPQVIFDFQKMARPDLEDLQTILCQPEAWFEFDTGRLEFINRIRLWRYVSGDDDFDAHYWLSRLENAY